MLLIYRADVHSYMGGSRTSIDQSLLVGVGGCGQESGFSKITEVMVTNSEQCLPFESLALVQKAGAEHKMESRDTILQGNYASNM
jgi:hypothetical protein